MSSDGGVPCCKRYSILLHSGLWGPRQYMLMNPLQANSSVSWYFLKNPHLSSDSHSNVISGLLKMDMVSYWISHASTISSPSGLRLLWLSHKDLTRREWIGPCGIMQNRAWGKGYVVPSWFLQNRASGGVEAQCGVGGRTIAHNRDISEHEFELQPWSRRWNFPRLVDSTYCHFISGFVLKVVSEVDEMCLFHQLGYGNRERERPQSTVARESGLQGIRVCGHTLTMGPFSGTGQLLIMVSQWFKSITAHHP
jgi:hypothetical protein